MLGQQKSRCWWTVTEAIPVLNIPHRRCRGVAYGDRWRAAGGGHRDCSFMPANADIHEDDLLVPRAAWMKRTPSLPWHLW